MILRVRTMLQSRRRGLLVLSLVVVLSAALAWAHGAPGADHMGEEHGGGTAIVSMCLAVVQAVGSAALVAALVGMLVHPRRRVTSRTIGIGFTQSGVAPAVQHRARAGPEVLQVFLR